ncbi:MAG: hypothetical protein R3E89_12635 [Thiolinea sp.]
MMDRVMHRVLVDDPFIKEKHHSLKPLYAALVPVQGILIRLEHALKSKSRVLPNWQEKLDYIKAGQGNPIPVSVDRLK